MDLYAKVEKVIQDHINEHKEEVRRGKQLLGKLDVARCNSPTQDYSFDLSATGERFPETTEDDYEEFWYGSSDELYVTRPRGKSKHWYDYDRNDPKRPNPFNQYTVTSGASVYNPTTEKYWYSPEAQGIWPDYTELPDD